MIREDAIYTKEESKEHTLSYSVTQFEGPLDLLLHLIQKAQVNIYDIPISEITDQFLSYLDMASSLDLQDLTDFYSMAAHLLYIKSNMLLPYNESSEDDAYEQDPRINLVEQLLAYQTFKKYSLLLADTGQSGELYIQRKKNQFMLPFEDEDLWVDVTVWDLLKSFSSLIQSITVEHVFNVYEEVTTKQKLSLMSELFEERDEISFLDIVVHKESAIDIICAFLAILEAVKFSMITIHQHTLFGDIIIRKATAFTLYDEPEEESFPEETFSYDYRQIEGNEIDDEEEEVIELLQDSEDSSI